MRTEERVLARVRVERGPVSSSEGQRCRLDLDLRATSPEKLARGRGPPSNDQQVSGYGRGGE